MPSTDATIGTEFKWQVSSNGTSNWTTTYDTMWKNQGTIACNQNYDGSGTSITNECNLTCKFDGSNLFYRVNFIAGYGTYTSGTWSSESSVTSTAVQTTCS